MADPKTRRIAELIGLLGVIGWAWDSERFIFNPDFQAFVDSILTSKR